MNKKGSIGFLLIAVLAILFLVLVTAILFFGGSMLINTVLTIPMENSTDTGQAFNNGISSSFGSYASMLSTTRYIVVALVIGFLLFSIVCSLVVRYKPILFLPFVGILIGAVFLAILMSNFYEKIYYSSAVFYNEFNLSPATNFIMLHLPSLVTMVGFVSIVLILLPKDDLDQYYAKGVYQ